MIAQIKQPLEHFLGQAAGAVVELCARHGEDPMSAQTQQRSGKGDARFIPMAKEDHPLGATLHRPQDTTEDPYPRTPIKSCAGVKQNMRKPLDVGASPAIGVALAAQLYTQDVEPIPSICAQTVIRSM